MIFSRTPEVPQLDDYQDYRDPYLRPDFRYRCAYCLTHEFYFLSGDGGEIDHHRPINPPKDIGHDFSHLVNAYSNLYWTCSRCNSIKSNKWPSDSDYAQDRRFLDPCVEDHDDHWTTNSDGTVTPTTDIGRYTVRHIRLDRRRLNAFRGHMYQLQQKVQSIERLLHEKEMDDWVRVELEEKLETLKSLIEPPVFAP